MKFDTRNSAKVDALVAAFLSCELPEGFQPDGGISFKPLSGGFCPTGTNLFTAIQLKAMFGRVFELMESREFHPRLFFSVESEKHERKLIDRRLRMQRRELKRLNRQLRYVLKGVDIGIKLQPATPVNAQNI